MSASLFGNDVVPETYTVKENKTYARKLFREIKSYLVKNGNYNKVDDYLIGVYANALADIRRYNAVLEISGDLITGIKGRLEDHPYVRLKQKAIDTARNLASSLGVLSMNRKKLDATLDNGLVDDFSRFFPKG